MAVESAHEFAAVAVPEFYLFVEAARGDVAAVGREEYVVHGFAVAHHLFYGHLAGQLEEHHCEIVRPGGQPFLVMFHCLFIEFYSFRVLVLALEAFTRLVTPSLYYVLGGEGHAVNPVAVLLQLS